MRTRFPCLKGKILVPRWRVMMKCYVMALLATVLGVAIQIQGKKALRAPAEKYVNALAPYWFWALAFSVPGIITTVLLCTADRKRALFSLSTLAGVMVTWSVLVGAGSVAATGTLGVLGTAIWLALAALAWLLGQAAGDL